MAALTHNSCKAHVLRRYPTATCTRRTWKGVDYYDVRFDESSGTVDGSAMSAKAAWHYAYAKMVSTPRT